MDTLDKYADDPSEMAAVPTGMDTNPTADEEVIDPQSDEPNTPAPTPRIGSELGPEHDLANAIAYALDGSGIGITDNPPQSATPTDHKVRPEGITGAGFADEEAALE